jgi:hypothetical protein
VEKRKKQGGRSLGTPNKTTKEIRELISYAIEQNIESLVNDLRKLPTKERVECMVKLLRFIVPMPTEKQVQDDKIEVVFVQGKTIL